jgi:hypothetical protein
LDILGSVGLSKTDLKAVVRIVVGELVISVGDVKVRMGYLQVLWNGSRQSVRLV